MTVDADTVCITRRELRAWQLLLACAKLCQCEPNAVIEGGMTGLDFLAEGIRACDNTEAWLLERATS